MSIHRFNTWMLGLLVALAVSWAGSAMAEKVNCADEFRSGKLYFSQGILKKSVDRFATSVEVCPDKWEYRARYAMALAEYGKDRLVYLPTIPDEDTKSALVDSVVAMFTLAGSEFQAAWDLEKKKSAHKFVRENREHYFVDRYNQGIKLYEEKNYYLAELQFRLARLLDPSKIKPYSQGAIALIGLNQKSEAAELVQEGLKVDPEDDRLNELLVKIYVDAANELTLASEQEKDAEKAKKALWYMDEVMTRGGEEDPDLPNNLFKRGAANMALGSAERTAAAGDGASGAGVESFMKGADDFARAAEIVPFDVENPENPDNDFHLACLFNKVQCLMNAENCELGVPAITDYLQKNIKEAYMWQLWTFCLQRGEQPEKAAAAIMTSKSLAEGTEIGVPDAVANAKEDAAKALGEMGEPDFVYGYQTEDGYQVDTWFWPKRKMAMSFVLGVKNGEISW